MDQSFIMKNLIKPQYFHRLKIYCNLRMGNKCLKYSDHKFRKEMEETRLRKFNEMLSECLDKLGYSQEMIQYRRKVNKQLDEIRNRKQFSFLNLTTGGKAEGISLYYESDIDRLYVVKGVTCTEPDLISPSSSETVFHLDRTGCSPGYTRLKLFRMLEYGRDIQGHDSDIQKYLMKDKDNLYISNRYTIFDANAQLLDIHGVRINKLEKRGPSEPYENTCIKYDLVTGFECKCHDFIEKWTKRPRKYDWPNRDLITRISSTEGHVVPVANKGSLYPLTEWRVCYTKAELLLIQSLNECQIKLYILLKLIAKSELKPICSEMSSYIMKNIVFWVVEMNPKENFSTLFLIDRLADAFVFLKHCLYSNVLRSYMISDRNLLQGRITLEERKLLLQKLDTLIKKKENVFQHCDKINLALDKMKGCSEDFSKEAEKRDKIEKLVLKKNIQFKEIEIPGLAMKEFLWSLRQNPIYRQYDKELYKLIMPDTGEIDENVKNIYRKTLSRILR